MEPRDLAEADEEVGDDKDDERGDHGRHFTMDGRENSSIAFGARRPGSTAPFFIVVVLSVRNSPFYLGNQQNASLPLAVY
jgi:hypothetical protein